MSPVGAVIIINNTDKFEKNNVTNRLSNKIIIKVIKET